MKAKKFSTLKHISILPKCLMALAIAILCLLPAKDVQAYDYTLKHQIAQTQTSVTIQWDALSASTSYTYSDFRLYIGTDYASTQAAAPITIPASYTSYTINNLSPGTQYYVKLVYTRTNISTGSSYDYSAMSGNIVTLPGKVANVRQDRWWRYIKSVDAVWDDMTGASGYEWEFRNSKNKKIAANTSLSNKMSNSIDNNMVYTLQVRAYTVINGTKYPGEWSDKAYLFTQPEVTKVSISGSKLKVNWKKISGATGYEVWASTKQKTGYKKVATLKANASSATIKKLQKKSFSTKKTYYVYVVAKKKVGKRTYKTGVNYVSPIKKGKYQSGLYYI